MEVLPSAQSSSLNEKFVSTSKSPEKQNVNFSRSALFHMKTFNLHQICCD